MPVQPKYLDMILMTNNAICVSKWANHWLRMTIFFPPRLVYIYIYICVSQCASGIQSRNNRTTDTGHSMLLETALYGEGT
jgi:hypothetical protein